LSADPLVIRSLEFLGPMATVDGWRPENELPEVAFSGRSNVGKSSLLNKLVRRKAFARVSNTPGRTREINFFKVNNEFVLADLPGYGYARIAKTRKEEWLPLIEGYLRASTALRGVVQLLDVRHHPSEEDIQMFDFLAEVEVPTIVALIRDLAEYEREPESAVATEEDLRRDGFGPSPRPSRPRPPSWTRGPDGSPAASTWPPSRRRSHAAASS